MTAYTREITSAALACSLDPRMVEALVMVESGGNTFAWNPEPKYRYLWNLRTKQPFRSLTADELASKEPPPDFPASAGDRDQEWWGQQASWGLMQLMGALARERGFMGPYLPQLCDPQLNLQIGCRHLRNLLEWSDGHTGKALGAYNAGRGGWNSAAGLAYSGKVFKRMEQITKERT